MYLPLILIFIQYFFQSKQTGINSTTAKNCFLASNFTLFLFLLFVLFCFVSYLDPIKSIITILFLPKNFFFPLWSLQSLYRHNVTNSLPLLLTFGQGIQNVIQLLHFPFLKCSPSSFAHFSCSAMKCISFAHLLFQ